MAIKIAGATVIDDGQNITITGNVIISGIGRVKFPVRTTAQRPSSPTAGDSGFNSTTDTFEIYDGTDWLELSGGVTKTTAQTATTTETVIGTYDTSIVLGGKYAVQAYDTSSQHRYITELLITHDTNNVAMTEYGQVGTGPELAQYDADISAGNLRIKATPLSSNTTDFTILQINIT